MYCVVNLAGYNCQLLKRVHIPQRCTGGRRVRTSNNHLISITPLLHPLAKPLLTVVVLVTVRRVDEVTAGFDEGVEKLEALLLVHGTHEVFPRLTDAHGTEGEWRDTYTGMLGENTETTERGLRLRCGLEKVGHCEILVVRMLMW